MADKRGWLRSLVGAAPTESEARGEYETLKTKALAQKKLAELEKSEVNPVKKVFVEALKRVKGQSIEVPGDVVTAHQNAQRRDAETNSALLDGVTALQEGEAWPGKPDGTATMRYVSGSARLIVADQQYAIALKKLKKTKSDYTDAADKLDVALRETEKKMGYKRLAAGLQGEMVDQEKVLSNHRYVLNTDLAEFRQAKGEGDATYNKGKQGYYGEAVDAYTEAKEIAARAIETAAKRQKIDDETRPIAEVIENGVQDIEGALKDKALAKAGLTPVAIKAMVPDADTDPRAITGTLRRCLVQIRQKDGNDYQQAATDIARLHRDVEKIFGAVADLKALITYRDAKKRDLAVAIAQVKVSAGKLLPLLASPEWEKLEGPGSMPRLEDLTGLMEVLGSVEKAAEIGFKSLYSRKDIDAEYNEYRATTGYVEEGIGVIVSQVKEKDDPKKTLIEEMSGIIVDEALEKRAIAEIQRIEASVSPQLDALQEWDWPEIIAVRKDFEARLSSTPPLKASAVAPGLRVLEGKVHAAYEQKVAENRALIDDASTAIKTTEATYKSVYDTAHKVISWRRATANDALDRLRKEIDVAKSAYDVSDPVSARGVIQTLAGIDAELAGIRRAAANPDAYKSLYALRTEIADLIEAKPLSERLENRSKALTLALKTLWAEAETLQPDAATKKLEAFKKTVEEAGVAATELDAQRDEAAKKLKEYKAEFKTLTKAVKTKTKSGKVITKLRGDFAATIAQLDAICDKSHYEVDEKAILELRLTQATHARTALLKDGSTTELDVDKAIASHRESEAEDERVEAALIAWERACALFDVDLKRLKTLLEQEGDIVDAEVIEKTYKSTQKMVKESRQTEAGNLQLKVLQNRVDELAKNPWAVRASAMEAMTKIPEVWSKAVTETQAKLAAMTEALNAKVGDDVALKQQTDQVVTRITEVTRRFNPRAFDNHCLLLSSKESDRKTRRKNKETALRQVAIYRAYWDDPAIKRLMLNPFKISPVFTEAYKAIERMMFEFQRFPD